MRLVLAVLVVAALAGCSVSRAGPPRETTSAERTETTTTTTTDAPPSDEDEAPEPNDEVVTTNPADCVDGTCRLAVSGPVTIPLDGATYNYTSLVVVAVTSNSLLCQVPYPGGGGADLTVEIGGSSAFGFQDLPSISLRLETVVNGTAVLNLTPGDPL